MPLQPGLSQPGCAEVSPPGFGGSHAEPAGLQEAGRQSPPAPIPGNPNDVLFFFLFPWRALLTSS